MLRHVQRVFIRPPIAPRRFIARTAASVLSSFLFSPLQEAAGWRVIPREEAARSGEALVAATVKTPHRCYMLAGHWTIELDGPVGAPALVLTPGYASGSALFGPILDALATRYKVYCVDWLGTGASLRPAWTAKNVTEGETFFVDGLKRWADAARLTDFALGGHSLGGYLSAAFALAHPKLVRHLLLIDPAGLTNADPRVAKMRGSSWVVDLVARAWEGGVTPASLVRALGPWGETATRNVVTRRFAAPLAAGTLPIEPLALYFRCILTGPASAEQALAVLLAFGAQAKVPMGPRLVEQLEAFPVTLVFGEYDWVDGGAGGGVALAQKLKERGVDAECAVVRNAGHFVFIEAPRAFERVALTRLGGRRE